MKRTALLLAFQDSSTKYRFREYERVRLLNASDIDVVSLDFPSCLSRSDPFNCLPLNAQRPLCTDKKPA